MSKYTAQSIPTDAISGLSWYVRENHRDGRTAQIVCYCHGEAAAKEVAAALTLMDESLSPSLGATP